MSTFRITLTREDLELSPGLITDGYSEGMEVNATTTGPYDPNDHGASENASLMENAATSGEVPLFVGGHPVKGRNGLV